MKATQSNRRRFLKDAALAGVAMGAIPSAVRGQMPHGPGATAVPPAERWAYGQRSRFETTVRRVAEDSVNPEHMHFGRNLNTLTPLHATVGIITPAPLHFVSAHGYYPPDIDPREYRLMIHGMVDRPLVFTLAELKQLPSITRIHYLECQANVPEYKNRYREEDQTLEVVHGKTGCSQWTGVLLSVLLKEAGVRSDASWVVSEGSENGKITKSVPLKKAMHDVLVAYGQNGEAVRPENGYPVRLVVPGFEAINSVKWLRRIKVTDRPYMGYHEIGRFAPRNPEAIWFTFEQGPKSVITFPSAGQRLTRHGMHEVTGLAWTGGGLVRRVEVSADGGRTWRDAQLQEPILRMAHTRFTMPWNWNGQESILMSRCIDELGQVQPTLPEFAKFFGTTSERILAGESSGAGHSNAIQPWGIRRDGSVYNALS